MGSSNELYIQGKIRRINAIYKYKLSGGHIAFINNHPWLMLFDHGKKPLYSGIIRKILPTITKREFNNVQRIYLMKNAIKRMN